MNNQEKIIFIIIFIIFIWTFFILKKSTFIKSDYEPSKKNIIKTAKPSVKKALKPT